MALTTAAWSSVGVAEMLVVELNATRPTAKVFGRSWTNCAAAAFAASSRSGETSVARIEPLVSSATTTVAFSRGTFTSAAGRAKPVVSAAIVRIMREAGRWRRQPGRRGMTPSTRPGSAKRCS